MENEIDKLLEERGKVHGNSKITHACADALFQTILHWQVSDELSGSSRAMLFLIMVKIARGVQVPSHADHWKDIAGYARLIEKQECSKSAGPTPYQTINASINRHGCYQCGGEIIFHKDRITRWVVERGYLCENCSL